MSSKTRTAMSYCPSRTNDDNSHNVCPPIDAPLTVPSNTPVSEEVDPQKEHRNVSQDVEEGVRSSQWEADGGGYGDAAAEMSVLRTCTRRCTYVFPRDAAERDLACTETFDFSTPNEWLKWRKRFERYLVVSGMKKKEEADKIDLFMYLMGDRADDIFRTFKFEKEEEATKIDSVLKAFDSHFCVRKNIIYERAKFNSRIQEDREPVNEFITSLYKLADSCEFEGLHDQLIRDRIVVGVRDKALSERMQLDSELTLEKAVKMVRQQEAVRQQQVDLQRPSTSQKVNQVKFNSKKQSPKQQQQPSGKKEKSAKTRSRCPKCGGFTHREGQACRAEGQRCNLCSKTGHFINCCPAVEDSSNLDDDEGECRRRWTAEIQVNGKQLKFKLDSQADVTCVPLCLFKKIMGQQRLVESDINIRAAEFYELQTVGMFISTLRNGNYEIKEKIYVIRRLSEPLLSRRACELLNLARRIEVVATRINPIKEFPEVFEGLGQIGNPYEIKLKPGAKPYAVHTSRRVPIPLMKKLKTRLEELEKAGIIAQVDVATEWCAPTVIAGMDGVMCYLDDILIFASDSKTHDRILRLVLRKLKEAKVTLNKAKCVFGVPRINFLGHILDEDGIRPDPAKIEAVAKMPAPTDVHGARRFLGMVNHLGRFVENLSEIVAPLNQLLVKGQDFVWDCSQERAFRKLKELLTTQPILAAYDVRKPTMVSSDASSYGLGAVLKQEASHSSIFDERIEFADPKTATFPDAYDEVWIRNSAYPWKGAARHRCIIQTTTSYNREGENERQTSAHINAVLSSITDKDEMLTKIFESQQEYTTLKAVVNYLEKGWPDKKKMSQALLSYWHVKDELGVQNGLLMRSCRLVIPASMKLEILEKLHAGHFGITKTRLRARETVWWPGISEEIAEIVRKCSVCIQEAVSKHEPLIPTNFPTRPWQKIGMDLFKFENKWYLVVIDYYSRFPEIIQLDRLTANVVVRSCKSIFARHGIPETVVSVNGTQFGAAREFANFARQYGFTHVTSSPRFPQSNGMAEAGVKIAKLILKKNQDPSLGLLEYRSTPLENGYSPAELLMGRKLRTTLPIAPENLNPKLVDSQTLKRKEGRRRKDMKSRYDRRCGATDMEELSEGDTVWITDMRTWGIVKQKASTPRSYMVDTPVGTLRRNRFHLRKGDTVQYPADTSTPTFSGEELVENEKTPVVGYPSNDSEDGQIRTRSGRFVKPDSMESSQDTIGVKDDDQLREREETNGSEETGPLAAAINQIATALAQGRSDTPGADLPVFDGTYSASQFFQAFDRKMEDASREEKEKLLRLPNYLVRQPLELFRKLRLADRSYFQVRQILLDLYPESSEASFAKYFAMKLTGQANLETYYREKPAMGLQLGLPQEVILETLTEGLPFSDQRLVRVVPPENLGEWFRLVQRIHGPSVPTTRHREDQPPTMSGPYHNTPRRPGAWNAPLPLSNCASLNIVPYNLYNMLKTHLPILTLKRHSLDLQTLDGFAKTMGKLSLPLTIGQISRRENFHVVNAPLPFGILSLNSLHKFKLAIDFNKCTIFQLGAPLSTPSHHFNHVPNVCTYWQCQAMSQRSYPTAKLSAYDNHCVHSLIEPQVPTCHNLSKQAPRNFFTKANCLFYMPSNNKATTASIGNHNAQNIPLQRDNSHTKHIGDHTSSHNYHMTNPHNELDTHTKTQQNPLPHTCYNTTHNPLYTPQFTTLLQRYNHIFTQNKFNVPCLRIPPVKIPTNSDKIITIRPYRVPICDQQEIRNQVQQMLENGIIEQSFSPFSSPVTLVTKRDKTKRFCIDYRKVNELISSDVHPLPRIEDILDRLAQAKYFSTADISSAYWQVPIHPDFRPLLAFATLQGLYQPTRLPFGLKTSPQIYERAMSQVLQRHGLDCVAHYFDDFIIYSNTLEEHQNHLRQFFAFCEAEELQLNFAKCVFFKQSIDFLGYTITAGTTTPLTRNTDIIHAIKQPHNRKTLRSYLGAVNVYNKFIPEYARLRAPLNNLLKKDVVWIWDEACQKAFIDLKGNLTQHPILHLYKEGLPCQVYCDASTLGIAGILKQVHPDGNVYPVQFFSRTLRPHEKNYSISELECFAIVESVEKFRIYLMGRKVTIFSDHHALQWLKTIKNPSGRLFRWSLRLSSYEYEVRYIKGKQQYEADLLSRNPFCGFLDASLIKTHQPPPSRESSLTIDRNGLHTVSRKGVTKIIIPKPLMQQLLQTVHAHYNHPGISQMSRLISTQYYWQGMSKDIKQKVKTCPTCQLTKRPLGPTYGELSQPPEAKEPFDLLSLDTIAGFAKYGNTKIYLHVVVDHFSRFAWTFPSKSTSITTYQQVLKRVLQDGSPKRLLTDRAPAFTSPKFSSFLLNRNIHPLLTTSNNPQANGLCERLNATLTGKLRLLHLENPKIAWTKLVKRVTVIYNKTPHSTTGFPPIYLMFGILPPELSDHSTPYPDIDRARKIAPTRTQNRHLQDKNIYDQRHKQPHFEVGDLVRGGHNVYSGFRAWNWDYTKGRDMLDVTTEMAREQVKPIPVRGNMSRGLIMSLRKILADDLKWRAVERMEAGQSQVEVAKWLNVNKSVVSKIWKQFIETGTIKRKEGSGRKRKTATSEDRYLVVTAKRHREMTAIQLSNELSSATGTRISRQTVYRRLHEGALYARRPMVYFRRVFIWREPGTRYHPSNIREIDSFGGGSLLVWAGISSSSRTPLHIFSGGTLTAQRYRDEILEPYLRPYRDQIGHNLILMDDNVRPHRARLVNEYLQSENIRRMDWPARSPDLNPIEHVWDALGRRIGARHPSPKTLVELRTALLEEWGLLPLDLLQSLVNSMGARCETLIAVREMLLLSCPKKSLRCLHTSLSQQQQCPLSLRWKMGAVA
ncbi:K02A2.6-like, partial [Cordylochernes scorpioides]